MGSTVISAACLAQAGPAWPAVGIVIPPTPPPLPLHDTQYHAPSRRRLRLEELDLVGAAAACCRLVSWRLCRCYTAQQVIGLVEAGRSEAGLATAPVGAGVARLEQTLATPPRTPTSRERRNWARRCRCRLMPVDSVHRLCRPQSDQWTQSSMANPGAACRRQRGKQALKVPRRLCR